LLNQTTKHFANPVRGKILLEIHTNEKQTAKQLMKKFPDIPQPTLYRYLRMMLLDGTLKITEEKQIRGTVEKTYAIAVDLVGDIRRIRDNNDRDGFMQLFSVFITGIMTEFEEYIKREDVDLTNDSTIFQMAPVYATKEEIHEALISYGEVVQKLLKNEPSGARSLHNICTIITPPKK
jgi:DNA-binding PadR family transcriptional regulator